MCSTFDLVILNGVCNSDQVGHYTFISDFGSSVNDYFLVSIDLFEIIYSSCNFIVSDNTQSQHMPLELSLKLPREDNSKVRLPKHSMMSSVKYVWNADQS